MTTITAIIQAAYREGNLLAAGASPTASETTEAVTEYNAFVTHLLQFLASSNMQDFLATAGATYPATLSKHSRIMQNGGTGTVNFTATPDDGARMALVQGAIAGGTLTVSGNGYTVGGAATQAFAAPSANTEWFYRADIGDWVVVKQPFVGADNSIFPYMFDDLIQSFIFKRFAPRYNKSVAKDTEDVIERGLQQLVRRYFQGARLDIPVTNLRGQLAQ